MTTAPDMTRRISTVCSLSEHEVCPFEFSFARPNCHCDCHFEVLARGDGQTLEVQLRGLAYECWASPITPSQSKVRGMVKRLYLKVQSTPLDEEIDNVTRAIQDSLKKEYWSLQEWSEMVEQYSTVKTPSLF